jgi:hypothetical protein
MSLYFWRNIYNYKTNNLFALKNNWQEIKLYILFKGINPYKRLSYLSLYYQNFLFGNYLNRH